MNYFVRTSENKSGKVTVAYELKNGATGDDLIAQSVRALHVSQVAGLVGYIEGLAKGIKSAAGFTLQRYVGDDYVVSAG